MAVKLTPEEKRYDIGNFPSYFESFVEFALADPVYGAEFRRVLERLLAQVRRNGLNRTRLLFLRCSPLLLVAARLCHVHILWEGDTLPLAAAQQMLHGKVLYRDIWFDKPPLRARCSICSAARAPGWALRLADALYALLACWIAWRFARDLWARARRPLGRGAARLLPDLRLSRPP